MLELFLFLAFVGTVWFLLSRQEADSRYSDTPAEATDQPSGVSPPLQRALDQLTSACNVCQERHPHALPALIFMAASDGTVSRQELRIILGFCERLGTKLDSDWKDALEYLNAGLNLSITGGEKGAIENIENLREKPMPYRAAFLGAAEAIVASNRTTNASKRKLLDRVRGLIE